MTSRVFRILGSTALSLLIAGGASGPSLALPFPGDGAVTPEACAALGYVAKSERDYRFASPQRATMAQGVVQEPPPTPMSAGS